MQDFPHHYRVFANAEAEGNVALKANDMPQLVSAPPAEFGGPGDQWSPAHLLVASVGDSFTLTFRAIARSSELEWDILEVSTEGVMERVDSVVQFTGFTVRASLNVTAETDQADARRLLEKAASACPVAASLKAPCHLEADIIAAP